MRTIKFRGKASHNGDWLYGDLINIHGEYHILGIDITSETIDTDIERYLAWAKGPWGM